MTVETIRQHLNPDHQMCGKGTKYDVGKIQGLYLISIGVVREYVESEKITKPIAKLVTKPEKKRTRK